ncbi:MAG: murein L,D-transpeptidase catalytic domain family protein [Flavisolibacter sp.]
MKKTFALTVLIMSLSLVLFSFSKATDNSPSISEKTMPIDTTSVVAETDAAKTLSNNIYDNLHLQDAGLSQDAVYYAVKGYEKLKEKGEVDNDRYLTIVDLSQSSRKKRFYILDMQNDQLVWNTYVAHGKNSGVDEATRFSNSFNSDESSLGFYITKNTYTGKHGLSLRISGQEAGFNDNAEARGVVVHGAPYVSANRVNTPYMGRSQGCPALPVNEYSHVINIIKGGTVLFVYHPDSNYLQDSQLLNS